MQYKRPEKLIALQYVAKANDAGKEGAVNDILMYAINMNQYNAQKKAFFW
jgi:hypothetical protein